MLVIENQLSCSIYQINFLNSIDTSNDACCLCCVVGIPDHVPIPKKETLSPPRHLVSPVVSWDSRMSTVIHCCLCHSDSASINLYSYSYSKLVRSLFSFIPLGLRSKRTGVRFPTSPLEFQRLVISRFQVAIWLK